MARKRLPIFHQVSKILKVSIFLAKMRKPIIPKLILFRKSQRFKLLRNNQYGEYEFSPSKSPLFGYSRKELGQRVYSMLFLCRGLGNEGGDFGDLTLQIEAFPAVDEDSRAKVVPQPLDWGVGDDDDDDDQEGEEDDSIDLRAEKFIERFYEEMRMQRQVSV